MIKVIFVCLGNICRSPMAEFIFKKLTEERGVEEKFLVTSRATSNYEIGAPIYPPAMRELEIHGIRAEHYAMQITREEVENADYVLVMDGANLSDLLNITDGKYGDKIYKLCSFTSRPRDVADPWYTRDFAKAYADIKDGCEGFLNYLIKEDLI